MVEASVQYICVTCGTQYPASSAPPASCPICEDERQYVGPDGQRWTTLAAMRERHRNVITDSAPGLTTIEIAPKIGIGQLAHLIQTPAGNVLWDCVALIDDATVAEIERRGGLAGIAISHPHFYTTIEHWSAAFGGIPVWLHRDDAPHVHNPGPWVHDWDGETFAPLPGSGIMLARAGGHFPGSSVLHWPAANDGRGALFTGDTIYVVADNRWVTFMYSYPNDIPLNASAVRRIVAAVEPFEFATLHAAFGRPVERDAKGAVRRSADRYIAHISG